MLPDVLSSTFRGLSAVAFLSLRLVAAPPSAPPPAPARPLSGPEEYGARLVSDYLRNGPEATWEALVPTAPLRRLGRQQALDEIEVRFGPPAEARWELRTPPLGYFRDRVLLSVVHPSGLDQAIELAIARVGDGYRLRGIRTLVEPRSRQVDDRPDGPSRRGPGREHLLDLLPVAAMVVSGALLASAFLARRKRAAVAALLVSGIAVAGATTALHRTRRAFSSKPHRPALDGPTRLGPALPARRRLEAGLATEMVVGAGPAETALRLWSAQLAQQRGDAGLATRLLAASPGAAETPWADVLRARLAFMEMRSADCVKAYQRLIDEGLYHDGLLSEALDAFSILGYPTGRDWSLEKLTRIGSRSADVHYLLARELQRSRAFGDPVSAFRAGWQMRPLDRRSLFSADWLWDGVLRDDALTELRIAESAEGRRRREAPAPAPRLSGARTVLCGRVLRESFPNGATLVVPEGVGLAPAGTPVEGPDEERREEDARALSALDTLSTRLRNPGAMSQPALRLELERGALALAQRHRWPEIARLTGGYSGGAEQIPPLVLLLRAEALRRTGRRDAAKAVLLDLERNPALSRLGDPGLLLDLASVMRASGDLSGAIRCAERARTLRDTPLLRAHLEGLRSEQELEKAFSTQVVGRFDLRFRDGADLSGPHAVGAILNAEWSRLSPWFPSLDGRPVEVDLLPWADFARVYGSEILGLYDGRIRVPVFGVPRFTPPVVAILTHELVHAMVADATADSAPSWFHEGLAQRLEMRAVRENRIPEFEERGAMLSLDSVEEVLRRHPDPELVSAAYDEAEWFVAYLEKKHGRAAIGRLIDAFRRGLSTEEALDSVTGVPLAEVEVRFREWALRDAPRRTEERVVVRYDLEER